MEKLSLFANSIFHINREPREDAVKRHVALVDETEARWRQLDQIPFSDLTEDLRQQRNDAYHQTLELSVGGRIPQNQEVVVFGHAIPIPPRRI